MPDSQKRILFDEGKTRSKAMIDAFKKAMRSKPGMIEILLADYLVQEKSE